jgi:hypothetical protein
LAGKLELYGVNASTSKAILDGLQNNYDAMSLQAVKDASSSEIQSLIDQKVNIEKQGLFKQSNIELAFDNDKLVIKQTVIGDVVSVLDAANPLHTNKISHIIELSSQDFSLSAINSAAFVSNSKSQSSAILRSGQLDIDRAYTDMGEANEIR